MSNNYKKLKFIDTSDYNNSHLRVTAKHNAPGNIIKQANDLNYAEITNQDVYRRDYSENSLYFQGLPSRTFKNFNVDEDIKRQFIPSKRIIQSSEYDYVDYVKPIFIPGLPRPEEIRYGDLDFPEFTRKTGSMYKNI